MSSSRYLVILFFLGWMAAGAQPMADSNYSSLVGTVTLYKNGVELEAPVLTLGGDDRLLLRFDILSAEASYYRYRLRHCDSRWQPDGMEPYEFVNGFDEGPIDNYNSSFTTLTDYVNYYQYLPAAGSRLLLSGNYIVTVAPDDAPDSILLCRRFCVTEEALRADVQIVVPYDAEAIRQRREVDVDLLPNVEWNPPAELGLVAPALNPEYLRVVVRQNGRRDLHRELPFSGYDRTALTYRNRPENIFPCGNLFRWFDISNLRTAMYNVCQIKEYGGETFAILCPLENRARKPFVTYTALNGGMKVNVWDRTEKQTQADYVYVNFALPVERPYLDGNIYVVGDLTQWTLDDRSRMSYNPDIRAYTLRLLLKQGYYSYQLLFLPAGSSQPLTATLEGDHFETPNTYYTYVYYRAPNDRYDRLVAYRRTTS